MRVNVYSQELTSEVAIIETEAATGKKYPGVRFILESSDRLHNRPDDDDRSAVTFWFHDIEQAYLFFSHAISEIDAKRKIHVKR